MIFNKYFRDIFIKNSHSNQKENLNYINSNYFDDEINPILKIDKIEEEAKKAVIPDQLFFS